METLSHLCQKPSGVPAAQNINPKVVFKVPHNLTLPVLLSFTHTNSSLDKLSIPESSKPVLSFSYSHAALPPLSWLSFLEGSPQDLCSLPFIFMPRPLQPQMVFSSSCSQTTITYLLSVNISLGLLSLVIPKIASAQKWLPPHHETPAPSLSTSVLPLTPSIPILEPCWEFSFLHKFFSKLFLFYLFCLADSYFW